MLGHRFGYGVHLILIIYFNVSQILHKCKFLPNISSVTQSRRCTYSQIHTLTYFSFPQSCLPLLPQRPPPSSLFRTCLLGQNTWVWSWNELEMFDVDGDAWGGQRGQTASKADLPFAQLELNQRKLWRAANKLQSDSHQSHSTAVDFYKSMSIIIWKSWKLIN